MPNVELAITQALSAGNPLQTSAKDLNQIIVLLEHYNTLSAELKPQRLPLLEAYSATSSPWAVSC